MLTLVTMLAVGAGSTVADIPLESVGATGALIPLVWLASTARSAYADHKKDAEAREKRIADKTAAEERHRGDEREHWTRVETALSQLPRRRD